MLDIPSTRPITDVISALRAAENSDQAEIVALALNAYNEALRRLGGRAWFTGTDVVHMLTICDLLLQVGPEPVDREFAKLKPTIRAVKPDEGERRI